MRDNPFLDTTVGGMLAAAAARFPDREAIVATDTRITYAGLHAGACRVARALLGLGIGKDDKVALWLPNRPAWLFAQYGCALIGAVAVALNPRYKAHELRYILAQSDSSALLLTDHLGLVDFLKVPRHIRIVANVPRTPGPHGDKVRKGKLRELFLAESATNGARSDAGGA
jgi:fatty-acyl-CoA synthase